MTKFNATKLMFAASLMMGLALLPAVATIGGQAQASPGVDQAIEGFLGEGGDTPVGR